MYIQISNHPDGKVLISRKLAKDMGLETASRRPQFIQLSRVKGSDTFAIVRREARDTFLTQCSMIEPTGQKRTPASFHWTIPSLEYFLAVTGLQVVTTRILKVKRIETPYLTCWKICNA